MMSKYDSRIDSFYCMAVCPILILLCAVLFEYSGFDIWWASHFFESENHRWLYKDHWFFSDVIHSGGQLFDKLVIFVSLLLFVLANFKTQLKAHRKIILFFIVATIAGPLVVGLGKNMTHIYTPWDLQLFGGQYPYIRLFDAVAPNAAIGHAFPAGHASGGYCFLSLYFVLLHVRARYRILGLAVGLVMGITFGLGQQIRGAHFPSHDLVTLVICWYTSLITYVSFYPRENRLFKTANMNFT